MTPLNDLLTNSTTDADNNTDKHEMLKKNVSISSISEVEGPFV